MPWATLPDARVHFETAGEAGSPVVLVMGFGVPGRLWRRQVVALSRHHRVAWFDNVAGGRTEARRPVTSVRAMARITAELIEHLGWGPSHVVGVSMGGMIAQELAIRRRETVRSLALLATHAGGVRSLVPAPRSLALFVEGFLGPRRRRAHAMQRLIFPEHYLARADQRHLLGALQSDVVEATSTRDRLAQIAAVLGHDTAGRLHRLEGVPTLVVKAGQDALVRPEDQERLARLIPGARLVAFEDAGHGLMMQHTNALNDVLLRHFAEVDAR